MSNSSEKGIRCNACDTSDCSTSRYECQKCPNYNLCTRCFNDKRQTATHSTSHPIVHVETIPASVDPKALSRQHADQMERLQSTYMSKMLDDLPVENTRTKSNAPPIKTLDKLSIDELHEFLLRLDPNLRTLADKLKSERVSGGDLVNFGEEDYDNCSITYGEKKKLQLLIEQRQTKWNQPEATSTGPDWTQMQNEISRLTDIVGKQEAEIAEKNSSIQQLEDIIEKQEQQTQLQNAIIKQLQEAVDQQSEEMRVLIEVAQQHRSLLLSVQNASNK